LQAAAAPHGLRRLRDYSPRSQETRMPAAPPVSMVMDALRSNGAKARKAPPPAGGVG